jgi:hypothetical protein
MTDFLEIFKISNLCQLCFVKLKHSFTSFYTNFNEKRNVILGNLESNILIDGLHVLILTNLKFYKLSLQHKKIKSLVDTIFRL